MLIDPDGRTTGLAGHDVPPADALVRAFGALVTARRLNDQAYALVRQGRLAVYPSSHGQEACQVAAAQVLADGDWLFPTLPRHRRRRRPRRRPGRGAGAAQGRLALRLRPVRAPGRAAGDPARHPAAARRRRRARRPAQGRATPWCMAMCGDGAHQRGRLPRGAELRRRLPAPRSSSSCRTTSTPSPCRWPGRPSRRRWPTRASGTACRASGSTATTWPRCCAVLGDAVAQARAGEGPQLVEAHTYRMQAHTNADDATRYRQDDEVAAWVAQRPDHPAGGVPARARRCSTTSSSAAFADEAERLAAHTARRPQPRRRRPTPRTCSPTSTPSRPRSCASRPRWSPTSSSRERRRAMTAVSSRS